MNCHSVSALLLALALSPTASAAQPLFELDPCGYAAFTDKAMLKEYQTLASKLNDSEPHKSLVKEWQNVAKTLRERMGDELFSLWNDTYGAVQSSVRSPILDDVQTTLMERCLNRLRRTPQQATDVFRRDTEIMRSLLALPDAEFQKQFRARMKATSDALGTPYAAGVTLRANLGIPRPN
jgi:hypothetical protein